MMIAGLVLTPPITASVTEPLPFGNTGNAASVLPTLLAKTTQVRIDFDQNLSVVVTDPAWIGRLKTMLTGCSYRPASYCFCYNAPEFVLLEDHSELIRFTVPHGIKLRFLGHSSLKGDFAVGKESAHAILDLTKEMQPLAVKQSPRIPPKPTLPKQLELKP